jgi:hypothetical protein
MNPIYIIFFCTKAKKDFKVRIVSTALEITYYKTKPQGVGRGYDDNAGGQRLNKVDLGKASPNFHHPKT